MTHEPAVREALRAIAEDEPVNAPAAWAAIAAGIDHDVRGRRRRLVVGGAAVVVAGAAAAFVILAAGDDPRREAVDIAPATDPPATTAVVSPPTVPDTTAGTTLSGAPEPVATSGPVPEHPLLVQRMDGAGVKYVDVYDAATGALLGTPLVEPSLRLDDPVIGPDGTIYVGRATGTTTHVEALAWGSTEPYIPFGLGNETNSPAISPDGTRFAYVDKVRTQEPGYDEIVVLDVASGTETRRLSFEPDVNSFRDESVLRDLEWSPDGSRLLFIADYEGGEALVVDADAESLSEAVQATDVDVRSVSWAGPDELLVLAQCCFPDYGGVQAYSGPVGALEPTFGDIQFEDLDAGSNGESVSVAGGAVRIIGRDDRDLLPAGSGAVGAELF